MSAQEIVLSVSSTRYLSCLTSPFICVKENSSADVRLISAVSVCWQWIKETFASCGKSRDLNFWNTAPTMQTNGKQHFYFLIVFPTPSAYIYVSCSYHEANRESSCCQNCLYINGHIMVHPSKERLFCSVKIFFPGNPTEAIRYFREERCHVGLSCLHRAIGLWVLCGGNLASTGWTSCQRERTSRLSSHNRLENNAL